MFQHNTIYKYQSSYIEKYQTPVYNCHKLPQKNKSKSYKLSKKCWQVF